MFGDLLLDLVPDGMIASIGEKLMALPSQIIDFGTYDIAKPAMNKAFDILCFDELNLVIGYLLR